MSHHKSQCSLKHSLEQYFTIKAFIFETQAKVLNNSNNPAIDINFCFDCEKKYPQIKTQY